MRWPAYPKYKDSGVDWLGEMPEEWDTLKLKYCVKGILQYGANEPTGSNALDQPRYIRITDLNDDGTLNPETFCSISYETAKPYLLSDKDVLLARSGATVGKSFLYRKEFGEAAYAGYLIRASTNKKLVPEFLYLFLQSSAYWQWLNSVFIKSTIQNVSAEKYAALILAVPSIDEQKEIIQFIFDKIDQYNALIAEQKKLIALLQEKRQAVISHAVTKGLNHDAAMKDSGVEWLGKIPNTWQTKALRYLFMNQDYRRIPLSSEERGMLEKIYPYYGASGIIDYVDRFIFDESLRACPSRLQIQSCSDTMSLLNHFLFSGDHNDERESPCQG